MCFAPINSGCLLLLLSLYRGLPAPPGTKKRPITLRRSLLAQTSRSALEEIKLKVRRACTAVCGGGYGFQHCKRLAV
jgi:hypothetical protein